MLKMGTSEESLYLLTCVIFSIINFYKGFTNRWRNLTVNVNCSELNCNIRMIFSEELSAL